MPDLLDELRQGREEPEPETNAAEFPQEGDEAAEKRFLGMTAVERMFITMFIFLVVLVIGAAVLLATGRLVV